MKIHYEHKETKSGIKYMQPIRLNASGDVESSKATVAKKMRGKKHYEHVMEKARGVSKEDRLRGVRWQNKTPHNEKFFKGIKENWVESKIK